MITDQMVEAAIKAWNATADDASTAEAMRAALTAALGDAGWQDISTAPKDGTAVDIWYKGVRYADCHWSSLPYAGDISWGWTCQQLGRIAKPTHWMPLPTPPLPRHDDRATT